MGDEKLKTIKDVPDEKIFRCSSCTTEQEEKWLSWNESEKQSIDGTRFGIFCPECKNEIGIYSLNNPVDLSKVKKNPF